MNESESFASRACRVDVDLVERRRLYREPVARAKLIEVFRTKFNLVEGIEKQIAPLKRCLPHGRKPRHRIQLCDITGTEDPARFDSLSAPLRAVQRKRA